MKQFRIKAQALTLVLIVVVVSIIVAFSITSRVIEDIKQQGEERASTRAEAFAESAVENLTQKLQQGKIVPQANSVKYAISTQAVSGAAETLNICDPNSTNVSEQCDPNSIAQVSYYNMVVQFKVFNSENIEVPLTNANTPVKGNDSIMIVHLRTAGNTTFTPNTSKILVKGYAKTATDVKLVSECVVTLGDLTVSHCLPDNYLKTAKVNCDVVTLNLATSTVKGQLGDTCFLVQNMPNWGNGVSFYRVKPLLTATGTETPYIDFSATGTSTTSYNLAVPQMALINAGVYSGTSANNQQVFQQSTRLVLLNKAVPEIADYVLYNGSANPIVKQ